MKKYKLISTLVCIVTLTTVVLAGWAPAPSAAPQPTKLTVAYLPIMSFAVLFVALEKGYFAEQGLEINTQRVNSGSEAMAFLASGQMDVGGGSVVAGSFTAVKRGFNIRIVASGAIDPMKDGPNVIFVRKDLWDSGAVRKVADLKGRRVAVSGGAGTGGAFSVAKAIQGTGLTVKDISFINMSNPDMPLGLQQKSIDACFVGSPYGQQIQDDGSAVVLVKDITAGQMVIVYMMSEKLLRENPDAATRFMVAMLKAVRDMQGDKYLDPSNMAAYVKWTGSKEETIRKTVPFIYHPNLIIQPADVVASERINREAGWTDYQDPLDTSKMIDESVLQAAYKIVGEVRFQLPK